MLLPLQGTSLPWDTELQLLITGGLIGDSWGRYYRAARCALLPCITSEQEKDLPGVFGQLHSQPCVVMEGDIRGSPQERAGAWTGTAGEQQVAYWDVPTGTKPPRSTASSSIALGTPPLIVCSWNRSLHLAQTENKIKKKTIFFLNISPYTAHTCILKDKKTPSCSL